MRLIRTTSIAVLALAAACHDTTGLRPDQGSRLAPPEGASTRGEMRRGWIFGPGGTPMEVAFEDRGGRAIFEGDIYLGPSDSIPTTRQALTRSGAPRYGVIIDGSGYRWAAGSVPYTISTAFSATQRQTILDAMAHIRGNNPGVSFTPRTYQSAYVNFAVSASECSSKIGKQGGRQDINLSSGCSRGNTIHEIMHALGMWHEQSRCDRDVYVEIVTANILSGKEDQFDKACSGSTDIAGYDEGSIMHYGPYAFSRNGQPTIRSRRGLDYLMGQRSGMSGTDVYTVHWLYAPPVNITSVTYPGNVPTIAWSPPATATGYQVYLRVEESFRDAYENWTSTSTYLVGSTTATSIQDRTNPYTGVSSCDYSGASYTHEFFYSYEVVASFPSGSRRSDVDEARVARC